MADVQNGGYATRTDEINLMYVDGHIDNTDIAAARFQHAAEGALPGQIDRPDNLEETVVVLARRLNDKAHVGELPFVVSHGVAHSILVGRLRAGNQALAENSSGRLVHSPGVFQ